MSEALPQTCEAIERLIPHAGSMCLLDRVISYDEQRIVCESQSHVKADNPLRNTHGLPMTAALEYAAQATAVHGNLLARNKAAQIKANNRESSKPRGGYLAVLSHVNWQQAWLHTVAEPLCIEVTREIEVSGGVECSFLVSASLGSAQGLVEAKKELVTGRMVVALFDE